MKKFVVVWESDRLEKRAPLFWRLAFNLDKFIVIGGLENGR